MGVKGVVNFLHCCLVMFLILSDLPSHCSSPIPLLGDFLNHKSSALPSEEKGQLPKQDSNGLLGKQVLPRAGKSVAVRTLGSLKTAQNSFNLKSDESQENNGLPVTSKDEQTLMQLRVFRSSAQRDLSLSEPTSKASASSGSPVGSGDKESEKQPWEFLPIKPQDQPDETSENIPELKASFNRGEHEKNSVVKDQSKPITFNRDLPFLSGTSVLSLGRLNLKTDWCNAHPFKETVRHHGCTTVEVENNMCYGQCNSFYIPKRFFSCSYCAPSRMESKTVRLECPGQNPSFVIKKVKIVLECACKDCGLPLS